MYNRLRIIYVISLAIIINSIMGLINNILSIFIAVKTFNSYTVNIKTLLPSILVIVVLSIIIIICKRYYKSSKEELTLKYNLFFVGVYLIISRLNVVFYMLIKTIKFFSQQVYNSELPLLISQIVIITITIVIGVLMIRKDIRQNKVVSIGEGDE